VARKWLWGRRFLNYSQRKHNWEHQECDVVITELSSRAFEIPDAIGWQGVFTFLIECKTSVADFKKDKEKLFRNQLLGMGDFRFFLTPIGLLNSLEIPDGWGLLETDGYQVNVIKDSIKFHKDAHGELLILLSMLRRLNIIEQGGMGIRTYLMETGVKKRATVSIIQEEKENNQ